MGLRVLPRLGGPLPARRVQMIAVSEVHPFADGNGRTARIMMHAELVAAGQQRIIIPTAYGTDYLGALEAFSHNGQTTPLIRMLDAAQNYTHTIDGRSFERARTSSKRPMLLPRGVARSSGSPRRLADRRQPECRLPLKAANPNHASRGDSTHSGTDNWGLSKSIEALRCTRRRARMDGGPMCRTPNVSSPTRK